MELVYWYNKLIPLYQNNLKNQEGLFFWMQPTTQYPVNEKTLSDNDCSGAGFRTKDLRVASLVLIFYYFSMGTGGLGSQKTSSRTVLVSEVGHSPLSGGMNQKNRHSDFDEKSETGGATTHVKGGRHGRRHHRHKGQQGYS
jgi:hypothetical protein